MASWDVSQRETRLVKADGEMEAHLLVVDDPDPMEDVALCGHSVKDWSVVGENSLVVGDLCLDCLRAFLVLFGSDRISPGRGA